MTRKDITKALDIEFDVYVGNARHQEEQRAKTINFFVVVNVAYIGFIATFFDGEDISSILEISGVLSLTCIIPSLFAVLSYFQISKVSAVKDNCAIFVRNVRKQRFGSAFNAEFVEKSDATLVQPKTPLLRFLDEHSWYSVTRVFCALPCVPVLIYAFLCLSGVAGHLTLRDHLGFNFALNVASAIVVLLIGVLLTIEVFARRYEEAGFMGLLKEKNQPEPGMHEED